MTFSFRGKGRTNGRRPFVAIEYWRIRIQSLKPELLSGSKSELCFFANGFSMGSSPDGYIKYIQGIWETFHLLCQVMGTFCYIASHKEVPHNSALPDNIAVQPMCNTTARRRQLCSSLWWVCEHWRLTEQQAETQITSAVTVQWTMSSASRCKAEEVHPGLFLCLECLVYRITIEVTMRPEATLENS